MGSANQPASLAGPAFDPIRWSVLRFNVCLRCDARHRFFFFFLFFFLCCDRRCHLLPFSSLADMSGLARTWFARTLRMTVLAFSAFSAFLAFIRFALVALAFMMTTNRPSITPPCSPLLCSALLCCALLCSALLCSLHTLFYSMMKLLPRSHHIRPGAMGDKDFPKGETVPVWLVIP